MYINIQSIQKTTHGLKEVTQDKEFHMKLFISTEYMIRHTRPNLF